MKAKSIFLFAVLFVIASAAGNAQEKMIFTASDITWVDAPPVLPAGTKLAVLEGDPTQFGFFTMRIKLPAGSKINPHWHPSTEHVTVMSGTFNLGFGDAFDNTKGSKLSAGDAAIMPAKHHHYAWSDDGCILQVHGVGPWQLYYVNADGSTKSDAPTETHTK